MFGYKSSGFHTSTPIMQVEFSVYCTMVKDKNYKFCYSEIHTNSTMDVCGLTFGYFVIMHYILRLCSS